MEYQQHEDFMIPEFYDGQRVFLVGPPVGHTSYFQFDHTKHRLFNVPGCIECGPNGSIKVNGFYWVRFEEDTQPYRQCDPLWLDTTPREID